MRDAFIEIDIDQQLTAVIQKLNRLPDQIAAPSILKNALNATARKVRKQITKDAAGQYAIRDKGILKKEDLGAPKIYTASVSDLEATIKSKGPMQEIMTFLTRPNTSTGAAAAQVVQSGTIKSLELGDLKAFLATFVNTDAHGNKSKHTAIVQRKGGNRLPIKKLLSPAVPHMLGNETVMAQAEALTFATLEAEIQKRIGKVNLGR